MNHAAVDKRKWSESLFSYFVDGAAGKKPPRVVNQREFNQRCWIVTSMKRDGDVSDERVA